MNTTDIDIRIEKVLGTERRLHDLIGPFVMNPEVIRLNGGYPFKNTEDHIWYIYIAGKNLVKGFISLYDNKLCNDFTWLDTELLEVLILHAMKDLQKGTEVFFTADSNDIKLLEKLGFHVVKPGTKYFKMAKVI